MRKALCNIVRTRLIASKHSKLQDVLISGGVSDIGVGFKAEGSHHLAKSIDSSFRHFLVANIKAIDWCDHSIGAFCAHAE